jgi:hypothetical protein
VIPIVAVAMVAILGMLALVIDVGALVTTRRRVTTATDSAALAAAQSFANGEGGVCGSSGANAAANAKATEFAQKNASTAQQVSFTADCGEKSVDVTYEGHVDFIFAGILGASDSDVPADATAIWGPVGKARPVPVMVFKSQLDACGIPDTIPDEGETIPCDFTYNSDKSLGPPYWGELDLAEWGSTDPSACNVSAHDLRALIEAEGWPTELPLDPSGTTPDCADNGRSTSVFMEAVGRTLVFPVVADEPLLDDSGNLLVNVLGFVKVTVTALDNGSTITLHTEWAGPRSQPGVPVVGGADFGERAVRLVG